MLINALRLASHTEAFCEPILIYISNCCKYHSLLLELHYLFFYSCEELPPKACENVLCKGNQHFYCKLDGKHKCRCPSCEDVDYWQRGK